jgi:hypothetical protein
MRKFVEVRCHYLFNVAILCPEWKMIREALQKAEMKGKDVERKVIITTSKSLAHFRGSPTTPTALSLKQ